MDWKEEARIGSSILMLGTALSTLSSLAGLGWTNDALLVPTLVIGTLVVVMVACAGMVMVDGTARASLAAGFAGIAGSLAGWLMVGHLFLVAYPGIFALVGFASLAFTRRAGARA